MNKKLSYQTTYKELKPANNGLSKDSAIVIRLPIRN